MHHCTTITTYHNLFVNYTKDAFLLAIRLWIASVFWKSGMTKLNDMASAVLLFKYEYKVPVIPPEIAAYAATAAELACPILLVFGLGARYAAVALLIMTAVIEFTYIHNADHFGWAAFFGFILIFGAGRFSLDHLIVRKCTTAK